MLKVVIIGYGEMFNNAIAGALDSGSKIVGVFRHDRVKYPRFIRWIKDKINPDTDYNYIQSYKLHEIKATSANSDSFRKQLLSLNPDIMIVASWSEKLEKLTYDMPKTATINLHPSLLPKYRGPNPYIQVIKNREEKTGITIHLVDDGLDITSRYCILLVECFSVDIFVMTVYHLDDFKKQCHGCHVIFISIDIFCYGCFHIN